MSKKVTQPGLKATVLLDYYVKMTTFGANRPSARQMATIANAPVAHADLQLVGSFYRVLSLSSRCFDRACGMPADFDPRCGLAKNPAVDLVSFM